MENKIQEALKLITIDQNGNWKVPNRKSLNMSIKEFAEFERERLAEFNDQSKLTTKYAYHYGYDQPEQHDQESDYKKKHENI